MNSGFEESWLPRFHVTAERNWLNDPNGPIHRDGRFHLFFQTNPDAPRWGRPHWGHVSSADLVTWTRHPMALSPGPDGPDRDGCLSGCARLVDGEPVIYYTGVAGGGNNRVESICRAVGSPDLERWTKDPANPLAVPTANLGSRDHRDPFLWNDGGGWHLLLGSGTLEGERHGSALVYHSPDGRSWLSRGVFFEAPRRVGEIDLGEVWECPQLLRFDDDDVLIVSAKVPRSERPLLHSLYFVGKAGADRFGGRLVDRVDHGPVFYAPAAMVDAADRTLLWGWIQDELPPAAQQLLPRVGALSLPRVVQLVDKRLRTAPAPEVVGLRIGSPLVGPVTVEVRRDLLPELDIAQLEIAANISGRRGTARWDIGFGVDDPGSIRVTVDLDGGHLLVDGPGGGGTDRAPIPAELEDEELRIFLDGSIIEVYLGGFATITVRRYPADGHRGPIVVSTNAGVLVSACTVWQLRDAIDY
jgi:beta-fructofuranosidase